MSEGSGRSVIEKFLIVACFASLLLLVFLRYRLTIVRYFDADEFAHLHWAYSFLTGEKPYSGFFYIFPPYFLFPISIIMSVFGRSVTSLIMSRMFILTVQMAAYVVLFLWAKKMRGFLTAILTLIVFVFLPLPSDKLQEIRPDLLATVFAMAGLYLYLLAFERQKTPLYFWSGAMFSASIFTVPKTVFFLLPVMIVSIYQFLRQKKGEYSLFWKRYLALVTGAAILGLPAFYIIIGSGKPFLALYLISKLASDVTRTLGLKFYMRPDIFFYPNDTFYGMPGLSRTLIANLVIYLTGIIWGIKNFVSSLSHENANKNAKEFIFSASLFVNLFAFVKIFPLKHLQYLIPVSFFAAFYFADFLVFLTLRIAGIERLRKKGIGEVLGGGIIMLFVIYVTYLGNAVYKVKSTWTNNLSLQNINRLLPVIGENEAVFDLTGETIFYPDGYYFCCLPYGQYEEVLNFQYPDLETDMARRGTDYVHAGNLDRLGVIPVMQRKYIEENFESFTVAGMLKRKEESGIKN